MNTNCRPAKLVIEIDITALTVAESIQLAQRFEHERMCLPAPAHLPVHARIDYEVF